MAGIVETQNRAAIGSPAPPPAAVVVAVSGRFADAVRSSRLRQFVKNACLVAAIIVACIAVIAIGERGDAARRALISVALVAGTSLFVGALVRPRPFELGVGLLARGGKGRISPLACVRGAFVLPPTALRELAEGLVYGAGLLRHDPAVELAAWIILALAPPHGPGPGVWVSLEGVGAAGLQSLPEDLRVAVGALVAQGWITVDRNFYPPSARLEDAGLELARSLGKGTD